uniref:Ig-like domain-containing protein n=1 Tax=Oryctolagus cuniculus TaxID=9986 RepID=G1SL19_RABIT
MRGNGLSLQKKLRHGAKIKAVKMLNSMLCMGGAWEAGRHWPPSCAGMYDTPTLWVQPVPKVTSGENVIFYCQLETVTNTFFLLQEGWPSHTQGSHRAVPAEFPMGPVTSAHTGTYRCFGAYSGHVWSFPSEPVKLLVTGTLPKPSIWADPGPLVAMVSPVTLWCQGSPQAEVYRVYKEGRPLPWEVRAQQDSRHKADFPITMSMSSYHTGQYWCVYRTLLSPYQSSDPLTMVLTGMFPAPSLSAQPSLVVASGGNVSLSCRSEYDGARTAHLLKEGGAGPLHSLEARFSHVAGVWQATFLLGPVDSTQGGIYRCYYTHTSQPHVWSLPSEPLELQVTGEGGEHLHTLPAARCSLHTPSSLPGMYRKPSLQAKPGTKVSWGVTVALRCGSGEPMDTFLLHKVGSDAPPQHLRVPGSAMAAQATFTLGPVTSAHGGTYRCYGTPSTDPYLWSWLSDPLQVKVSGEGPSPVP